MKKVRSSVFVMQFEGKGHGGELGIAVPQDLCAWGVACTSEPPAEACEQLDRPAQMLWWSEVARAGEGASTRSSMSLNSTSVGRSGTSRPSRTFNWMRQAMTILMAMARSRRSALWCWSSSTLQPGLRIRK